jgi:hypothetical protein
VNVFRHDGDYVVALTYGPESDWVKNVLAASGCELITRGCCIPLVAPHIEHDKSRRLVPAVMRPMLRLLRVADFLYLGSCRRTVTGRPGTERPLPDLRYLREAV